MTEKSNKTKKQWQRPRIIFFENEQVKSATAGSKAIFEAIKHAPKGLVTCTQPFPSGIFTFSTPTIPTPGPTSICGGVS